MAKRYEQRHSDKDIARWLRAAQAAGWQVYKQPSGHWRATPPDPAPPAVVISNSPNRGRRSKRNIVAMLRRSGLEV